MIGKERITYYFEKRQSALVMTCHILLKIQFVNRLIFFFSIDVFSSISFALFHFLLLFFCIVFCSIPFTVFALDSMRLVHTDTSRYDAIRLAQPDGVQPRRAKASSATAATASEVNAITFLGRLTHSMCTRRVDSDNISLSRRKFLQPAIERTHERPSLRFCK